MNSHYDPDHKRFCSPERWREIQRLRPAPHFRPGLATTDKRGGARYYMLENLTAVARPRKRIKGELERMASGARLLRVDRQGERLLRARNMEPGVSGKSFRRRFRKELRAEKAAANA